MEPTVQEPAADLHADQLVAALKESRYSAVTVLDRVDSTNVWLADRVRDEQDTTMRAVVAGFQSAGKGRLDRHWFTPPGEALTFSVACTPRTASGQPWPAEYLPWLSLLMAHSVTRVVRERVGVPAVIKWPNDVLVGSRKLCGVLASVARGSLGDSASVVVGAGLNVSQEDLPIPSATSLLIEAGGEEVPTRQALLTEILRQFARVYRRVGLDPATVLGPHGDVRAAIESQLDTLGRRVNLHLPGDDAPVTGTAEGLGVSGELIVRDSGGQVRSLSAGDVVHVRSAAGAPPTAAQRVAVEEVEQARARTRQ